MPDEYFRPGPGPITLLDPLDPLYHQDFNLNDLLVESESR